MGARQKRQPVYIGTTTPQVAWQQRVFWGHETDCHGFPLRPATFGHSSVTRRRGDVASLHGILTHLTLSTKRIESSKEMP